ncbi:MAG TPA: excinuclease ABC subunit UvrC [bacterium]
MEDKLRALPDSPGVYLFKDDQGKVIYIGKALVLRNRVRQYFQSGHDGRYQFDHLVKRIADVEVIATDTELEALILENNLVRDRKPRYNIDLRDDKSFPFLRVSNEPFPRVFLTRHPVLDGSRYFGPYSDLYHLKGLIRVLRSMLKIRTCNLPLTEDAVAQGRFKACLEFHIGRCNAPCIGNETMAEYARRVRDFVDVVSGKGNDVVRRLNQEMQRLSDDLKFEQAAQLRDWLSALEMLTERQKVISPEPVNRDVFGLKIEDDLGSAVVLQIRNGRMLGRLDYRLNHLKEQEPGEILESAIEHYYSDPVSMPDEIFLPFAVPDQDLLAQWLRERAGGKVDIRIPERGDKAHLVELAERNAELCLQGYRLSRDVKDRVPQSLRELQKQLSLSKLPDEIIAFDISTLMGTDKVASMVMFREGKPARSQYRVFKIRTVEGMDDFASMHEVVGRRFARLQRENKPFPDLVLIDGGKGQLAAAGEALAELGIVDQPIIGLAKRLEEVYLPGDSEPQNIPKTSSALKLLQQIRDEAHRFAITYHRKLRRKRSLQSLLDEIDGVGPARRQIIFSHFGTVRNLQEATLEQIESVDGIPKAVAAQIFAFFHDKQQQLDHVQPDTE